MRIGGIDPGLKGWLAVRDKKGLQALVPLPFSKGKRPRLDLERLQRLFIEHVLDYLYLEAASPRPGEGTVSSFTSGRNWGEINAIAWSSGAVVEVVPASVWRKAICGDMGKAATPAARKLQAIQRAGELYPRASLIPKGCRVAQSGAADSLLILHYGWGLCGGR